MGESSSVDWELCKENVQPLRRGRNVASLNTIFTISKDELSAQYTEEMRSFEEELLAYTGKDPLEMWIVYITWIEENRPQGGGSLLVSVLQKCIEKFCEDPRYVNDQRYFDIWKKYVSCCGKALEVYNYLHCNMIFQKLSTFYINWALELESCGNLKGANTVYDKGIRADAEPKDDLISYQQDFFARMAQDVISNLQSPTYENEMLSEDCRTSLRLLKPKDANNTVGIIRNETSSVNFGENQTSSNTNVVKKNRPAFKICGDENGDTNHLVGNIVQPSFKPKAIVSLVCNKENEQRAGKWTKNKLRNERLVPVKGGIEEPIFQIHQDAPSEMEGRKVTVPVVLNPKKIDDANIIEVVNSKKMENPTERVMYCKEKIYAGITEISFEELHAMRWKAKQEKIKMREEELLMQRKAYEEMAMQSRDAIVQEVMKLLKNSVTPGNSCSEITVSNIVHQQCANLHASCASASQEPSMDKCPRLTDNENLVAEPENICIFEDPVVVQPVETENAVNQIEVTKEETGVCHNVSTFDDLDENDENVPPAGYVQVRESGPITGILLPSTRVTFLEVDESESDSEEEEEDDEEVYNPLGLGNFTLPGNMGSSFASLAQAGLMNGMTTAAATSHASSMARAVAAMSHSQTATTSVTSSAPMSMSVGGGYGYPAEDSDDESLKSLMRNNYGDDDEDEEEEEDEPPAPAVEVLQTSRSSTAHKRERRGRDRGENKASVTNTTTTVTTTAATTTTTLSSQSPSASHSRDTLASISSSLATTSRSGRRRHRERHRDGGSSKASSDVALVLKNVSAETLALAAQLNARRRLAGSTSILREDSALAATSDLKDDRGGGGGKRFAGTRSPPVIVGVGETDASGAAGLSGAGSVGRDVTEKESRLREEATADLPAAEGEQNAERKTKAGLSEREPSPDLEKGNEEVKS